MGYIGDERIEDFVLRYSNKELFEKIDTLSRNLDETQRVLKQYNGLRKDLDEVCAAVSVLVAEGAGKNKLMGGIIISIGVAGTLMGIVGGVMAIVSQL